MSENRKPQIAPEVDATGVRKGVGEIKAELQSLVPAADQAGKKASAALDGIADSAEKVAVKSSKSAAETERAYGRLTAEIIRVSAQAKAAAEGTGKAGEILNKALGQGLDPGRLQPYLDGLRQAEAAQKAAAGSLGTMEMSAKQTAAALRGVPAQFTDVFTSLASGQQPLTVFLQQGGQLKDMFGGAGNAARALGGYVAGLINPLTLAAAAVAGLGYAYAKGSAEAQEFQKTLILTGNQAGVTANQLMDMAAAVRASGAGTQGRAAEIINLLAASGRTGAENFERFAAAALQLERAGGPAAEATAKAFAEIAKAPLEATLKLDEAMNFLTRSQQEQIRTLMEQGRQAEAAKLAQLAYFNAVLDQSAKLEGSLSLISKAWRDVSDEAKKSWDSMLNIGRGPSLKERLADVGNWLEQLKAAALFGGVAPVSFPTGQTTGDAAAERNAAAAAKEAQSKRDAAEAAKILVSLGIKQVTLAEELERVEKALTAAGKDRATINKALEKVREGFADKAAIAEANRELEGQKKLFAELAGLSGDFEKEWGLLNKAFKDSKGAMSVELLEQAQRKLLEKQPFMRDMAKEQADAAKAQAKARDELTKTYEKEVDQLEKSATQAKDQVQRMQDEEKAAALAATGFFSLAQAIQIVTAARLQEQLVAERKAGNQEKVDAIAKEIEKRKELVQLIGKQESRKIEEDALKSLDAYLDPARAQSFGEALSQAFGAAGSSLAKLSNALGEYGRQQAEVAKQRDNVEKISDPAKRLQAELKLTQRSQEQTIDLYANMAGAAKGFFAEGSRGYKTLQAAEDAFRVYQLASDLQKGLSAAAVGIANQAQGDPYSAIPRMAAMAAIMAGLGFAVSGGFAGGGSTGGDGAKQATGTGTVFGDAQAKSESIAKSIDLLSDTAKMQLSTQSGMLAALKSIEANIGGLSGLILRSGVSSGDTASQFGIREGYGLNAFNAFGKTALGILDSWTAGVFTKLMGSKTTITGNGLFSGPQSLGSILTGGLNLQDYADVNSKQKFLGITVSNKNSTQYQASDPVLKQQFGLVFQSFADALKLAATPLGVSLDDIAARINSFTVDIGKIDLKGLTGDQIQEKLQAVLGAAGDSIASAALPGLNDFQKIGEGYLETVIRVASGVETAGAALDLLGIQAINFTDVAQKQGDVGAEIVRQSIKAFESLDGSLSGIGAIIDSLSGSAEDLAQAYTELDGARQVLIAVGKNGDSLTAAMLRGAGGLDKLKSSLETYFDAFFTDQEKAAAKQAQLAADFAKIGITSAPTSREAFKALVSGIDTSTEAGQKFYAQVIGLAGAFDEALKATEKLAGGVSNLQDVLSGQAKTRSGLQVDLLTAQGDVAGAAALKRQLDLAGITGGLSAADAAAVAASYDLTEALRAQIKATQEAAAAAQRVLSERTGLETQLLQAQGNTAALRERELAALDPSNRALKQMIYALEDQAKVSAKAAEAAQKVTDAMSGLGDTRFDLENQLLSLSGNDAEVLRRTRERDLARLTEGLSAEDAAKIAAAYDLNTALKQQIDATNAAAQAAEAIAQAQQQAAEDAQRAAEQLRSAWQSVADSVIDEVKRIRGEIVGSSSQSFANAQMQFALTTAQARAGDQEAAKLLPGLSQTLLTLAEAQATSLFELQRIRAQTAASLEGTAGVLGGLFGLSIPRLATGTNEVPADMLAILHKGEAVVPAAYNPVNTGSNAELVAEIRALREEAKVRDLRIVQLTAEMNRRFKEWDASGLPHERVEA